MGVYLPKVRAMTTLLAGSRSKAGLGAVIIDNRKIRSGRGCMLRLDPFLQNHLRRPKIVKGGIYPSCFIGP